MTNKIAEEPVITAAVVTWVVAVAAVFGLKLDPALVLPLVTVIGVVAAYLVRRNVTPAAHLEQDNPS